MRRLVLAVLGAGLIIGPVSAQSRLAPDVVCEWSIIIAVQDTDGTLREIKDGRFATEETARAEAEAASTRPVWAPMTPLGVALRTATLYPASAIRKIQLWEPTSGRCR